MTQEKYFDIDCKNLQLQEYANNATSVKYDNLIEEKSNESIKNSSLLTYITIGIITFIIAQYILSNLKPQTPSLRDNYSNFMPVNLKDYTNYDINQLDHLPKVQEIFKHFKNYFTYFHDPNFPPTLKEEDGLILYGPPGTGKTYMINWLFGEISKTGKDIKCYNISAGEFMKSYVGEGEANIRELFKEFKKNTHGSILFIDEIDTLCTSRSKTDQHSTTLLNQLLSCISEYQNTIQTPLIIIGATNYYDKLDESIIRPGRLSHNIEITFDPTLDNITKILKSRKTNTALINDFANEILNIENTNKKNITPSFINTYMRKKEWAQYLQTQNLIS